MWPWEHLSIGYLLYSGTTRLLCRRPPGQSGTLVLALGTQVPDLVDKTGGWVLDVLPSGTSLAHSVFLAFPLSLLGLAFAWRRGVPELGVAFALGYLSHLAGDVAYPILLGGGPAVGVVFWPLGPPAPPGAQDMFAILERISSDYVDYLTSSAGVGYLLIEIALLGFTALVWWWDRLPGLELLTGVGPSTEHRSDRR